MSFQHFRLQPVSHPTVSASSSVAPSSLSQALVQPQAESSVQGQPYNPNTPKKGPYGSGDADDGYTLVFESMEAFQAWKQREEEEKVVEFVKGDTHGSKAVPPRFKDHTKLVCARHSRSGRKKYVKKYPDRVRKVPSRKLEGVGCPASISFKTYFDSDEVRVCYVQEHSHEIGLANLPFTKRGRKAQAEMGQARRQDNANEEDSSSTASPSVMTVSTSTASTTPQHPQQRPPLQPPPAQSFHSAVSMLAPLPPAISPQPHIALSQERWDRMSVLFGSIRNHARNFEYPSPSVVALESVLIRLYLESPIGGGMGPGEGGLMEGNGHVGT